jgi:predicted RNase H-like HicB family nuclease
VEGDTLGFRDIDSVSADYVGCRREVGMATTVHTAIIEKEGNLYAALCPELDVASQGATVEEATANLREAVELFLESADPEEIKRRLRTEVFVTRIEAKHG